MTSRWRTRIPSSRTSSPSQERHTRDDRRAVVDAAAPRDRGSHGARGVRPAAPRHPHRDLERAEQRAGARGPNRGDRQTAGGARGQCLVSRDPRRHRHDRGATGRREGTGAAALEVRPQRAPCAQPAAARKPRQALRGLPGAPDQDRRGAAPGRVGLCDDRPGQHPGRQRRRAHTRYHRSRQQGTVSQAGRLGRAASLGLGRRARTGLSRDRSGRGRETRGDRRRLPLRQSRARDPRLRAALLHGTHRLLRQRGRHAPSQELRRGRRDPDRGGRISLDGGQLPEVRWAPNGRRLTRRRARADRAVRAPPHLHQLRRAGARRRALAGPPGELHGRRGGGPRLQAPRRKRSGRLQRLPHGDDASRERRALGRPAGLAAARWRPHRRPQRAVLPHVGRPVYGALMKAPRRSALIAFLLMALAAPVFAQTVRIDATLGHAINAFDPDSALGSSIDVLSRTDINKVYTPHIVQEALSAGWGPITYRNNTELRMAAWHWTENGTWSDAAHRSGYFTGSTDFKEPIRYILAYALPHRGFATSGDRPVQGPNLTYWKSNPYLTSKFTGESDALHPQWVVVDLQVEKPVSAIGIAWASPYARSYQVEYWVGKDALDFDLGPRGEWKIFPLGAITNGQGGSATLKLADAPVTTRYLR